MTHGECAAIAAALRSSGASDETIAAVARVAQEAGPQGFSVRRFTNASRPLFEVVYSDGSKLYSGPDYDGHPFTGHNATEV